jgi:hypothetical protein
MLGFIYDIIVLLIGIVSGFYFLHKSSDHKKSRIFGIIIFALCLIYGYVSYVRNVQTISTSPSPKDSLIVKNDSISPIPKEIKKLRPKIKHSTKAINDVLNVPDEYSKAKTRAYLSPSSLGSYSFKSNEIWKVIIGITNTGETPAYNERSVSRFKCGEPDSADVDNIEVVQKTGNTIGSKQTISLEATTPAKISTQDSINVQNGKCILFVYGKIWYDDHFGESHIAPYCIYFRPYKGDFVNYEKFNDPRRYEKK